MRPRSRSSPPAARPFGFCSIWEVDRGTAGDVIPMSDVTAFGRRVGDVGTVVERHVVPVAPGRFVRLDASNAATAPAIFRATRRPWRQVQSDRAGHVRAEPIAGAPSIQVQLRRDSQLACAYRTGRHEADQLTRQMRRPMARGGCPALVWLLTGAVLLSIAARSGGAVQPAKGAQPVTIEPGGSLSVSVGLDSDGDVFEETDLAVGETVNGVLPANAPSLTLKFTDGDRLVPVVTGAQVELLDPSDGVQQNLSRLFTIRAGAIVARDVRTVLAGSTSPGRRHARSAGALPYAAFGRRDPAHSTHRVGRRRADGRWPLASRGGLSGVPRRPRHESQSLDLPQPSVELIPTRENAAHHPLPQYHHELAGARGCQRRQESNLSAPTNSIGTLTKPSGRFTILRWPGPM